MLSNCIGSNRVIGKILITSLLVAGEKVQSLVVVANHKQVKTLLENLKTSATSLSLENSIHEDPLVLPPTENYGNVITKFHDSRYTEVVQAFIYDKALFEAQLHSKQDVIYVHFGEDERKEATSERYWEAIKNISPVYLLDMWKDYLLCNNIDGLNIDRVPLLVGGNQYRVAAISIVEQTFIMSISTLIQKGELETRDYNSDYHYAIEEEHIAVNYSETQGYKQPEEKKVNIKLKVNLS